MGSERYFHVVDLLQHLIYSTWHDVRGGADLFLSETAIVTVSVLTSHTLTVG